MLKAIVVIGNKIKHKVDCGLLEIYLLRFTIQILFSFLNPLWTLWYIMQYYHYNSRSDKDDIMISSLYHKLNSLTIYAVRNM